MQTVTLTPSQSRDAREHLALSQGRVAADTGISRSYLSQFECGKLVLSDAELKPLRDFYEAEGIRFEESPEDDPAATGANGPRVRDGFWIPDGIERESIDSLLDQMADNDKQARQLLQAEAPRGLLGTDSAAARQQAWKAIGLMARSWMVLQQVQGRQVLFGTDDDDKATVGDIARSDRHLRRLLHI